MAARFNPCTRDAIGHALAQLRAKLDARYRAEWRDGNMDTRQTLPSLHSQELQTLEHVADELGCTGEYAAAVAIMKRDHVAATPRAEFEAACKEVGRG